MLEVAEDDGISGDASQPSSSSSSLYAPKPAYDQLEVYSGGGDEVSPAKQRRSGLSTLHQAEILSKISAAASGVSSTNGLPAPSSSPSDATSPTRPAPTLNATPVAGGTGGGTTTPALPSILPSVMALVPTSVGARSQTSAGDGVGRTGNGLAGANVTVEVTEAPALEHDLVKPSSSCSTSSLTDSSGSVSGARETNTAQTGISPSPASVPWPELPSSPTMARLQDAGLPPSTPISKLLPNELESVFRRVELGLKIDRVTLLERLEVLRRQRDTAHANYYRELDTVNTHMMALDGECLKGELGAELVRLKRSLAVLAVAVESLVSSAQQWAAVQHEWSCSRAVEALQIYTDHTIALLTQANKQIKHLNTLVPPPAPAASSPRLRATSLNPPQEQRRLSLSPGSRAPGSPRLMRSSSIAAGRRASLQPSIKPFKEPPKLQHLSGGGGGGMAPALNLARVSSIVEESSGDTEQDSALPGLTSTPPSASSTTASSTVSPSSSRNNSNTTTTTGATSTASVVNRQSVSRITLRNSVDGGGDGGAEQMEGNTADLTEEALARLQNFYRRALETPPGDTDDLFDDEFGDPEDDELVDLDDDLMDELLECEASHQPKYYTSPGLPGASDSIYQTRLSGVVTSVFSWLRGSEQWPWSHQQTAQGARYFLCCALLLMALVLLVAGTLSCPLVNPSGDGLHCRQGWSYLFSPCRPFVQLTYLGNAPVPT